MLSHIRITSTIKKYNIISCKLRSHYKTLKRICKIAKHVWLRAVSWPQLCSLSYVSSIIMLQPWPRGLMGVIEMKFCRK